MRLPLFPLLLLLPVTLCSQSLWEDEQGPYGGSFVDIVAHGDGLAAAPYYRSFVLFGSADGRDWRQADLPDAAAQPFSLCPAGARLLAGGFGRVYRTDDDGKTWQSSAIATDLSDQVTALAAAGDMVFGCAGGHLFRSVDRGERWTEITGFTAVRDIAVAGGRVFVADEPGVAESVDGGVTWTVPQGSPAGMTRLLPLGDLLFASREPSPADPGRDLLFRRDLSGWTWESTALRGFFVRTVARQGSILFAGGAPDAGPPLLRSDDAGATWTPVGETRPPFHGKTDVLVLHAAGNALLASVANLGIWRLAEGAESWRFVSGGYFPVGVARVGFAGGRLVAYSMKENTISSRSSPGAEWETLPHDRTQRPGDMLVHGEAVLLGADGGTRRTTDFGLSWTETPIAPGTARVLALGEAQGIMVAGCARGVYAWSADQGRSWQSDSTEEVSEWFTFAAGVDGRLYAATAPLGLMVSDDGGRHWTRPPNPPPARWVFDVAVQGRRVVLAHSGGIDAWLPHQGGELRALYTGPAYRLCPTPAGMAAATQDHGIILFPGEGESWGTLNQGLPEAHFAPPSVCRIALRYSDERLHFGNCGLPGLWSIDLSRATGTHDGPAADPALSAEVSPQPFRGQGELRVHAPEGSVLRVLLCDALGRPLRLLFDGTATRVFRLPFFLQEGPSGMYFMDVRCSGRRTIVPLLVFP